MATSGNNGIDTTEDPLPAAAAATSDSANGNGDATALVDDAHAHRGDGGNDMNADNDDAQGDESYSEKRLFDEREQVTQLLTELLAAEFPTDASDVDAPFDLKCKTITTIFDRYLEQSYLLDPFLRELVTPIMAFVKHVAASVVAQRTAERLSDDTASFPFQLYRNPKLHKLLQLVYCLCKVRGFKTVVKLLPHEVSDFEPTLLLLQSQDRSDHATWETRYVLLLWLSMLCLVPFDLSTIDSSIGASSISTTDSVSIIANVLALCKSYLSDAGPTQEAASVCLARLLSRPDMEAHYLDQFLRFADAELTAAHATTTANPNPTQRRTLAFRVTGVMRSLAHIAKNAPRATHVAASRLYFDSVLKLIARMADDDACATDGSLTTSSTLHRKLSVKLVQRLGLLYLPPRVRSWRYKRGLRSLELNMQSLGLATATVSSTDKDALETNDNDDDDDGMELDAIDELEQIVEVLLCGLRDKDTVVRWSAAKGVGRITGRLPFALADDVVQSVLELFVATESDSAWHGASLALAELARRGVLLPMRLPEAAQCVARALQYDIRRGAHSIGAHVRDAACYACWSFARAYDAALFRRCLEQTLAPAMLVATVFDRELTCRRAASAAFQECIGRQGRTNFPHGIDLLTRADYFSVSNLRHAFLDVSVFVATYDAYRPSLLTHLVKTKLAHWDKHIRTLAATALGRIAAFDSESAMDELLPQLLTMALAADAEVASRHGATLALAEVVMALAQKPVVLRGDVQSKLKLVPIEVDKRRLFRGRGGELIRAAVCHLIEVIACACLSLSVAHVKKYGNLLEECLIHPVESVRVAATAAFRAFSAFHCSRLVDKGTAASRTFVLALVPRYLTSGVLVTSKDRTVTLNPNVAARRGFLRAIGVAAGALLQPTLVACVTTLMRAASIEQQTPDERDAESRVAAVRALVDICSRASNALDLIGFEDAVVQTLVQCVRCDYGVDERGDVGSWVRKEAIVGLETLLLGTSTYDDTRLRALVDCAVDSKYGAGTIVRVVAAPQRRENETDDDRASIDPLCVVQFAKPTLGFYYFPPHGRGFIRWSALEFVNDTKRASVATVEIPSLADRIAFAEHHKQQQQETETKQLLPFAQRISPHLVSEIFCELSKQLAEKLDGVRLVAGTTLFRLLHATTPRVDAIPDRATLARDIFPPTLEINWSMAHDTFPLVVQLLSVPTYLEAVASGLVLSVGGLTESVVKAAKAALFDWLHRHVTQRNFGLLTRFAFFHVTLLVRHAQDDRVTLPLLKTLALLLESSSLAFLFTRRNADDTSGGADFGDALYAALRDEVQRTTAIPKIAAAVAVLAGLLPSEPASERRALKALVLFLGHRFPKVRKLTAERLYTRLLVHEEVVDAAKYDAVIDILSETAWDGSIATVREARNELLDLLDMERPAKKQRAEHDTRVRGAIDAAAAADSESYKTLVKEMGY